MDRGDFLPCAFPNSRTESSRVRLREVDHFQRYTECPVTVGDIPPFPSHLSNRTGGCEGAVQPERVPYPQSHQCRISFRLSNSFSMRRRTLFRQVEDDVGVLASICIRCFSMLGACSPSDHL